MTDENEGTPVEQPAENAGAPAVPPTRNFAHVRVGRVPGPIREIVLDGGRQVRDALEGAGIPTDDASEIRVNGVNAELNQELNDGDTVLVLRKVRGA